VEDKFNQTKGSVRYLSAWDADWISFYDNSMHLPEVGGGTVYFKKEYTVGGDIENASTDITADETYELFINDQLIGKNSDWKKTGQYNIKKFLRKGTNLIFIKTNNNKKD